MENIGRNLENLKENLERLQVENIADSEEKDIASKWVILTIALFYRGKWVESSKLKLEAFEDDAGKDLRSRLNCKSAPKMLKTANYLAEESEVRYLESRGGKGRATKEFRITEEGVFLQRLFSMSVMIRSHIFHYQGLNHKDAAYRLLNIDDAWESLENYSKREKNMLLDFLDAMNSEPSELKFKPEEDNSEQAVRKFQGIRRSEERADMLEKIIVENEKEMGEKEQKQILKIIGTEPRIGNRFLLYPKSNSQSPLMQQYDPRIKVGDEEEYLLYWTLFEKIQNSEKSDKKLLKGLHKSIPDSRMDEVLGEKIEEFSQDGKGQDE